MSDELEAIVARLRSGSTYDDRTDAADLIEAQEAEITRLRAKVDAVYSERNRLAAAFARMAFAAGFKAGKGVDPDETKWPVVYVDTPNGQVSWHIAEADQGVLEGLPQYNGEWDGKFTARDPAWSVWPAADLVATARRDAMEQAALKSRITELEAENAGLSANECLHDIHGDESGNLYCPRIAELEAALQDIASGRYSNVLLPTHPPQDPAVVRARAESALEGEKE